jgi:hypothetical protein
MTMAIDMWQRTEEMAKEHEQGGPWLKLANDGDTAVVVFLGEPFPREVCFVDGKYLAFDDTLKAEGQKPSLRIALRVALYDSKEVKVLEQGLMFFKDLVRVREKYGLEKWAFEVQRHGAAKDPKTTYSILPEHQLSLEEQRAFNALPLFSLEELYADEDDAGGEDAPSLGSYDEKVSGTVEASPTQALIAQLKALPREAVDKFLQRFGIQRIKDLPAEQMEKASAFVAQLQAEADAATSLSGPADPFQ